MCLGFVRLVVCRLRRSDEALSDFSAALELEPSNPVFFHNRGFCYRNL